MKYKLSIFTAILNIVFLSGQEKLFDNILNKVEKNIDKNYYSDSTLTVRHSEYIINDSIKDFEKVVCVEYLPTPMWAIDGKFYNQKFGFNNSIFSLRTIGYLITAKMYKKDGLGNFGFTTPHRFASSFSSIDIDDDFHSTLPNFVRNNRNKRENAKVSGETDLPNKINMPSFETNDNFENQKPRISINYENAKNEKTSSNGSVPANNIPKTVSIISTPIYTIISDIYEYIVEDVVYNKTDCYKLTKISKTKSIYKDFERQRFENELLNGEYRNYSEQQKNEFRQLVEYWANGETASSQIYIVDKKTFAILSFLREIKKQNHKGEWIEIEKITEKYQERKNKKYYQTSYTKLIRNYKGGFPNINNFLTLVVRTPLNRFFSLDNTTIIPRNPYLTYEDFCEKVNIPDDNMLFDWNKYEE